MLRKLALASTLMATALFAPAATSAGPRLPSSTADGTSITHQAQFWDMGRCRGWRSECAERWGWRTDRYHRCLARHGCERHRYGDRWD